jgi:hypothetical protein
VAANILNKHSRAPDKWWSSSVGFGRLTVKILGAAKYLDKPRRRSDNSVRPERRKRKVGRGVMDWIELAQDRDTWRAILNVVMNLWAPRCYPYFDVVVGLAWSHEPESYVGVSVCYW